MTELEEQYFDYIQSMYPRGLRSAQFDVDSLVWKYDVVRSFVIALFKEILLDGTNQLLVDTATEDGLLERELFLGLPVNPSLTIQQRRAIIKATLSGSPATLANLKAVVTSFIGNPNDYNIEELWQSSTDPTIVWQYIVNIYNTNFNNPTFYQPLIDALRKVHPAHCELIMGYTYPIADAIGIEDAIDSATHQSFIWATAVPAPTDGTWSSYATPLLGSYWS